MSELIAIQQLWLREMKQMVRRPARIVGLLMQPLIWLFIFGLGVGTALNITIQGLPYILFILPGILGMKMVQSASRAGIGILRDRQAGFLKEVFVAPVRRMTILFGVAAGQVSRAVIQGMLLIAAGFLLGLRVSPWQLLLLILVMTLVGFALVMLGIALAWVSEDATTFGTASNFIVFPMFLLSGGLYQASKLPAWMAIPIRLNPLTYAVDAMRQIALGEQFAHFPLYLDLMVLTALVLIGLSAGSIVLRRAADTG